MTTHIMYHSPCHDGTTSAAIAMKALNNVENLNFIPANYDRKYDIDQIKQGETLYVLDFSMIVDEYEVLLSRDVMIIALDHHVSAFKKLDTIKERFHHYTFDKERSGAGITWDHFYPDVERPLIVNLVEDRDLWKFKYEMSKPIYCYMQTLKYSIESVLQLIEDYSTVQTISHINTEARAMYKMYDQIADGFSRKSIGTMRILDKEIVMFNVPPQFGSEVCSKYVERHPDKYAGYIYITEASPFNMITVVGLRSIAPNTVNDLAESKEDGGGHPQAAGYSHHGSIRDMGWLVK